MFLLLVLASTIFSTAANISIEIKNVMLGFVDHSNVSNEDRVECISLFDGLADTLLQTVNIMDKTKKLEMKTIEIEKKANEYNKTFEIAFFEINKQIEKYTQKQIKCIENVNNMYRYDHYSNKYHKCNAKITELTNLYSVNQTKLGNLLRICSAQKEECLKQKQDLFEKLKTNVFYEGIKIVRLIKILAKYKKIACDRIFEYKCKEALEQLQKQVYKKYSVFQNNQ